MTSDAPRSSVQGVARDWADAFVLELRMADVPGPAIGEALAEVRSHCAESGEPAPEAFGDPVAYARSLDLPAGSDPDAPLVGSITPWAVQTLGLLLLTAGAPALVAGGAVTLTSGHLAALVLLVATLAALGRRGTAALRLVVERPVVAWLALMAYLAVLVASVLVLDGVVVRLPGAVAVVIGAAAMVAGTAWAVAVLRRDVADDPVVEPLAPTGPPRVLATTALRYGPALLSPVVAVALVGMHLLLV